MHSDAHGHNTEGSHAAHGPEGAQASTTGANVHSPTDSVSAIPRNSKDEEEDVEKDSNQGKEEEFRKSDPLAHLSTIPQVIGIFILEFGILLHSALLGLTLAVDEDFKILFVVIVFHR